MQVCQDFLNGRCHRSNCRYQHQARPDGTMPEQIAVPVVPKFIAPPDLDETLYDPTTGFGLFGKPTYGTRYGSGPLPIIRAEDTRPICIEFFNSGRCTRRGPHGQSCMYRHVAKDDPNKVDQNKLEGGAAKAKAEVEKKRLPPDWVSQSSLKHPLLPSVKKFDQAQLAAAVREWLEAHAQREEEEAAAAALAASEAAAAAERKAEAAEAAAAALAAAPAAETAADEAAPAAEAAAATDGPGLLTAASGGEAADAAAREEYLRKLAAWQAHNQAYQQQQQQQQQQAVPLMGYGQPAGFPPPANVPYPGVPPPGAMRLPVAPPPQGRPAPY